MALSLHITCIKLHTLQPPIFVRPFCCIFGCEKMVEFSFVVAKYLASHWSARDAQDEHVDVLWRLEMTPSEQKSTGSCERTDDLETTQEMLDLRGWRCVRLCLAGKPMNAFRWQLNVGWSVGRCLLQVPSLIYAAQSGSWWPVFSCPSRLC
jgi:hypothetical protein